MWSFLSLSAALASPPIEVAPIPEAPPIDPVRRGGTGLAVAGASSAAWLGSSVLALGLRSDLVLGVSLISQGATAGGLLGTTLAQDRAVRDLATHGRPTDRIGWALGLTLAGAGTISSIAGAALILPDDDAALPLLGLGQAAMLASVVPFALQQGAIRRSYRELQGAEAPPAASELRATPWFTGSTVGVALTF